MKFAIVFTSLFALAHSASLTNLIRAQPEAGSILGSDHEMMTQLLRLLQTAGLRRARTPSLHTAPEDPKEGELSLAYWEENRKCMGEDSEEFVSFGCNDLIQGVAVNIACTEKGDLLLSGHYEGDCSDEPSITFPIPWFASDKCVPISSEESIRATWKCPVKVLSDNTGHDQLRLGDF